MSDKISPVEVVREAIRICWAYKGRFSGLTCLTLAPMALMVPLVKLSSGNIKILVLPLALLFMLSCVIYVVFVVMAGSHLTITELRGNPALLPEKWMDRGGLVFVRGFVLWLTSLLVLPVVMAPTMLMGYLLSPESGGEISGGWGVLLMLMAAATILIFWGFMARVGVMMPGASVGQIVSIFQALKMTSNHTIRMLLSFAMIQLPVFVLFFLAPRKNFNSGNDSLLDGLLFFGPAVAIWIINMSSCISVEAVWYEKLRLRHEAQQPTDPPSSQD